MGFVDWVKQKFGFGGNQPPPKSDDTGRLPQPGRYGAGQYPNWNAMLGGSTLGTIKPISPSDARDGIDNSIVGICINWIATAWLMGTLQVGTVTSGGDFKPLPNRHPFLDMIESPESIQDEYSNLSWSLLADYLRRGNAYLHIVRTNGGSISFEHIPARYVRPVPDDMGRLWYYAYSAQSEIIDIDPLDIVHFKHGTQELFPLLGVSPFAPQYREIVGDNAYSDYGAGLAKGGGIPPIVFTPRLLRTEDGETVVDMDEDTAKQLSEALNEKLETEPGKLRIIPGSLDMHQMGFKPDDMALLETRAMPETRIPAAVGLNALVLQLYTGIQKSTFTNMDAAKKQAWQSGVMPIMAYFARRFTGVIRREFPDAARRKLVFRYDTSGVPELQEDLNAKRNENRADVEAGIMWPDEARSDIGLSGPAPTAPEPVEQPEDPAATVTPAKRLFPPRNLKREGAVDPAPATSNIYDVANQFRTQLRNSEQSTVDEMASAWNRARAVIEERLNDLMDTDNPSPELVQRLQSLLDQIDEQLSDLADKGAAIVSTGQRNAITAAVNAAHPMATAMAGPAPVGVSLAWDSLPSEAFESLVGFASDGSPLTDLLQSAFGDYTSSIREMMLSGLAQGTNPRQVAAQAAQVAGSSTRARLETIARTEMLRASREASRRTYAANDDVLDGYVRLSAGDSRTCAACFALHGQKSETDAIMPTHPSCRCAMVPQTKSWAELTGDDSLPDTRPEIQSGADAFANLSEEDQRSVLGDSGYELYSSGQAKLSDFAKLYDDPKWGPSVQCRPVSEMAGAAS